MFLDETVETTTVLGLSSAISVCRPQIFFRESGGVLPLLGAEGP